MPAPVTAACLQTRPRPTFKDALDEALPLLKRAVSAGAEFITLPEYCGGLCSDGPKIAAPAAPEERHPVLSALREFANDNDVWALLGSIAVDGPQDRILNRSLLIDPSGEVRARYDKIHMFDIQLSESRVFRESASVCPGGAAVSARTPFGMMGLSICYDLRFPSLYRELAQAGAEILTVPAAFTKTTGEAHWHVLNRARAIENGAYVIAPCAVGDVPGGGECYGHSLIIDPWGRVLADGGEAGPGVILAKIDVGEAQAARRKIPSLSHDRSFTLPERPAP